MKFQHLATEDGRTDQIYNGRDPSTSFFAAATAPLSHYDLDDGDDSKLPPKIKFGNLVAFQV